MSLQYRLILFEHKFKNTLTDTMLRQKGETTMMGGGGMMNGFGFGGKGLIGLIFNLVIIVGIVILIV